MLVQINAGFHGSKQICCCAQFTHKLATGELFKGGVGGCYPFIGVAGALLASLVFCEHRPFLGRPLGGPPGTGENPRGKSRGGKWGNSRDTTCTLDVAGLG